MDFWKDDFLSSSRLLERDVLIDNVIVSVRRYGKFVDGNMESWEGWDWIWSCKEDHGSCKVVEGEGHASADLPGHSGSLDFVSAMRRPLVHSQRVIRAGDDAGSASLPVYARKRKQL